jgi:curved DNA-binding protein CbpA
MNSITNYPLCWPDNVPRMAPHLRGDPRFGDRTISGGVSFVLAEINRLNARNWGFPDASVIISTNLRPTLSGLPAGNQSQPADSGVAIYFKLRFLRNGKWHERPVVLTCDRWRKVTDNLRAIAKDIEAQRARARWGATSVEQAFRGYVAIPERTGGKPWWELLQVNSQSTEQIIKDAYRELAKTAHPDKDGDRAAWDRLQEAYDQALASFRK